MKVCAKALLNGVNAARLNVRIVVCVFAQIFLVSNAQASDQPNEKAPFPAPNADWPLSYVLGIGLVSKPEFPGASGQKLEVRPLASLTWGRITITSPRAGAAVGGGANGERRAGFDAQLFDTDDFRFNLGFRSDSGRDAAPTPAMADFPEIKSRFLYVARVGYQFTPHTSASVSYSNDVRGKNTGGQTSVALSTMDKFDAQTRWSASIGAVAADARYMRDYFGVPAGRALPTFDAGAGVKEVFASAGLRYQFRPHWAAFGNVTATRLIGDAAASPITQSKNQTTMLIGVAYQSKP